MEFSFARLIITLRLTENVSNAFALYEIKSVFSDAFRQTYGCTQTICSDCNKYFECMYYSNFAKVIGSDPTAVKRFQKPPFPFSFNFPIIPQLPNRDMEVETELVLIGIAIQSLYVYLEAFKLSLHKLTLNGVLSAQVSKVESTDLCGNRSPVTVRNGKQNVEGVVLLSLTGVQSMFVLSSDEVVLSIISPMRIMRESTYLRTVTFSDFVRPLFRRVSSLAYHYCSMEMDYDFKWLVERSLEIRCHDQVTKWVTWKTSLSGLTGRMVFKGNLADYLPFMLLGEYVHVGKGATFGLGKYCLKY